MFLLLFIKQEALFPLLYLSTVYMFFFLSKFFRLFIQEINIRQPRIVVYKVSFLKCSTVLKTNGDSWCSFQDRYIIRKSTKLYLHITVNSGSLRASLEPNSNQLEQAVQYKCSNIKQNGAVRQENYPLL